MANLIFLGVIGSVLYLFGRAAQEVLHRKRRSGPVGFLLGFVLGPVGLLLAVFVPRVSSRESHRCRYCERWISDKDVTCPHCGHGLVAAACSTKARPAALAPVPYDWTQPSGRSSTEAPIHVPVPDSSRRYQG